MLSPELEQILQQLYREARKAHYEFISLEHLLGCSGSMMCQSTPMLVRRLPNPR